MYHLLQRIFIILLFCAGKSLTASAGAGFYEQLINKAELSLTAGNYPVALRYYDSAFATRPIPLAQDLYNASLCALAVKQHDKAFNFCQQLAAKGTGAAFFVKKTAYQPLKKDKRWATLITTATRAKTMIREKNKAANEFLEGLYAICDTIPDWDGRLNIKSRADKTRLQLVDSLSQQLLLFIQKNGYPSEEITGVRTLHDTLLDVQPQFARIIQKRRIRINAAIDAQLKNALVQKGIQQGLLKADVYLNMTLMPLLSERDRALTTYYAWYGCSVYARKSVRKEEVAHFRQTLGACDPDDYLKKLVFTIQHPKTNFSLNTIGIRQDTPGFKDPKDESRYATDFDRVVKDIPDCR